MRLADLVLFQTPSARCGVQGGQPQTGLRLPSVQLVVVTLTRIHVRKERAPLTEAPQLNSITHDLLKGSPPAASRLPFPRWLSSGGPALFCLAVGWGRFQAPL